VTEGWTEDGGRGIDENLGETKGKIKRGKEREREGKEKKKQREKSEET
jgi:hypothetical protein